MKQLYLSSDHAGFLRKNWLKSELIRAGYEVIDLGPDELKEFDDYPDFAFPLAQRVVQDGKLGILLCGNGQGICMAANKVRGARAVSAFTPEMATTTRQDDNANILCLPGRFQTDEETLAVAVSWLETEFSEEERHQRRLDKIKNYER